MLRLNYITSSGTHVRCEATSDLFDPSDGFWGYVNEMGQGNNGSFIFFLTEESTDITEGGFEDSKPRVLTFDERIEFEKDWDRRYIEGRNRKE